MKKIKEYKYDSGLRYRTRIGSAIDIDLHKKLKLLSKETGIPISKLLDQAIKLILQNYDKV